MNLEVEHRCVGQAVLERLPGSPLVRRMPNADVGTDVGVVRVVAIHYDCVVFDIQQVVPAVRPASRLPTRSVEPPDMPVVTDTCERDVDRIPIWIGPIDADIGNEAA